MVRQRISIIGGDKMSALEMFEELGFSKIIYNNENDFYHDILYKDDYYNEIKFVNNIVYNMSATLTEKHIQAIHQQMIELGWL